MPIRIEIDRDYYSRNPEIYAWFYKHLGPTGGITPLKEGMTWAASEIFGYIGIEFLNESDFRKFSEYWENQITWERFE
jgi:hypothetical protein